MIKQLSLITSSKMKAQELLLLQHNLKPVVRQGYYEHELPNIQNYCEKNNLHFVKSNFKVLLTDETQFSNKGLRISENDKRPGMFFTYISKDEQSAWLANYYELMNNHKDLGVTLGYPECCINFFLKNFSPQNPNPQHTPTNPYTNISQRENDAVLISHFPCESNCPISIEQAKKFHQLLMKIDKEHAYELLEDLT